MFRKTLFTVLVLAAAGFIFAGRSGAAAPQAQPLALSYFEAVLSGGSEVPAVDSPASGRAVFVLDDSANTLYYRVLVEDLTGATAAHLHTGLPGENGPVAVTLYSGAGPFDSANPISGIVTLTPGQVASLQSGGYYANVHTTANPGGEIRGQVGAFMPGGLNAFLSGSHEVPPVTTSATGWARFDLTGSSLDYEIHVSGIPTITMAHLHPGLPGQSGPPTVPIYAPGDPRPFDPTNPLTGTLALTAQDVLDVLSGYLYLNVHTTANPGGEIRGQVVEAFLIYLPAVFRNSAIPAP